MTRDEIMESLGTVEKFERFINSLCLTDRQKEIVRYKYLRGWANIDIASELDISRRTVTEEMKKISKIIGKATTEDLR